MQGLYHDFEEKSLLGNFDWQIFFLENTSQNNKGTECDLCFWNMNWYMIIAELLLVLTEELKLPLFNKRYNVIIFSEHCSQELKDTHL